MTIQDAYNFFENLRKETSKKNELKTYNDFVHILSKLEFREFSESEIQSIEIELDNLKIDSNPRNRKRYFRKALNTFENFLKESFSLTTSDHYTKLGTALGVSFGMLFGVVFLANWERSMGVGLGLILGATIGILIGKSMDAKAKKENKVL